MNTPQHHEDNPLNLNSIHQMLSSAGEMGALIRGMDWSKTPLGAIEHWPQSLQTVLSICLFSRFPIHIWWGEDLVELYNDAYRPILGVTKHPASLGKPGAETSGDIWPIIGPMLRNVYENAVSTWSENLMLPMDRYGFTEETYFTLSYSPIFVETGNVGGIFTVVTETTKQVIGERRLRTLHHLSEHASEARSSDEACQRAAEILASNPEDLPFSLIYLLNETGSQLQRVGSSGFESESTMNPALVELKPETPSLWRFEEALASPRIIKIENLLECFGTRPPGPWEEAPHSALVLPIFASGGLKITGFLVVGLSARLALDEEYQHFFELIAGHLASAVANARSYEEERKRAEALAELDRAKTEFFSNISHEFRTPLTLMLNPLQELLRDSSHFSPDERENLELAQRNSQRLLKLVNSLLDFSRIQSNRIRASFEPVDLSRYTADLASNFRSVLERAGLRLNIDCAHLPEAAFVDREMWEKIVLNLLSNAFKFTFEGEISLSLRQLEECFELRIRDTGIGIAEADLPHIFERFHRVHGARSRSHEGSGIGLALVSQLVAFHGGSIQVESAVNRGTEFIIRIPRGSGHLPQEQIGKTGNDSASNSAAYTEEALRWLIDDREPVEDTGQYPSRFEDDYTQQSEFKILIVDDNADMRDYLRRLLQPRYAIELSGDGLDALNRIRQDSPALVLADVMMPKLDGFGLLKQLRAEAKTRSLPVLLLSARAGEEARIEGLQAGADDYLTKPFSARELLARIEAQLKLAQVRSENQATVENILETIADPFYVLDLGWHFIYANRRAQEMLGKSRDELIGTNIAEVFLQGLGRQAYELLQDAVAQRRPRAFETFSSFLNRWVEINIYPGRQGIAVYFRDIHERKQAEGQAE